MYIKQNHTIEQLIGLELQSNHKSKESPVINKALHLCNPKVIVGSGKSVGETLEGTTLQAGTLYHLSFGKLKPQKHTVLVDIHPTLCQTGSATSPRLVFAGESIELMVSVRPNYLLEIGELPWICRLILM